MAILAEVRHLFFGKFISFGPMWSVTFHAIFFNRWVFIHKGATLVSMAAIAKLIGVIRLNHAMAERAMGIVTVGAADLAFDDRVVRELI